ncbi:hypothetical protein [Candidatus Nanohalobium constans]|uniref:DUF5683 domain-containing protein n=1 Tax=Candidatus Nanohalobium constans TaxID=2565781 RepID=A0A5Q0UET9_9ARCH|nr:hypothetical protein [Candidatus Nanohalobium constans]QGA80102.1 hypothetical protein LC1Nh_0197 [Candidatus Nanohalobium constans]
MADDTYGIPALLSFFLPGLGQIIKGQVWKGIGLMLGAFISGLLALVLIGFLIYPIIWIYSVYDAYNTPAPN